MISPTFVLGIKTWTLFFTFYLTAFSFPPPFPAASLRTTKEVHVFHSSYEVSDKSPANPRAAWGHFPRHTPKSLLSALLLLHFLTESESFTLENPFVVYCVNNQFYFPSIATYMLFILASLINSLEGIKFRAGDDSCPYKTILIHLFMLINHILIILFTQNV